MRPAAVLFDCDGVLVDSEATTFDLLQADFAAHGLHLSRQDLRDGFQGGTMQGVMSKARARGAGLPEGWVEDFYERLYLRLAEGTPLVEGVEAVLDRLDAAGIVYAVGSNGSRRKMGITLGQHPQFLARLKGRLFSGQELGLPKPHPGLWLHCAAVLGVGPGDCVVVDDSASGLIGAAAAGMRALGFAPHGGQRLAEEGVPLFRSMAELPGLLGL